MEPTDEEIQELAKVLREGFYGFSPNLGDSWDLDQRYWIAAAEHALIHLRDRDRADALMDASVIYDGGEAVEFPPYVDPSLAVKVAERMLAGKVYLAELSDGCPVYRKVAE